MKHWNGSKGEGKREWWLRGDAFFQNFWVWDPEVLRFSCSQVWLRRGKSLCLCMTTAKLRQQALIQRLKVKVSSTENFWVKEVRGGDIVCVNPFASLLAWAVRFSPSFWARILEEYLYACRGFPKSTSLGNTAVFSMSTKTYSTLLERRRRALTYWRSLAIEFQ